MPEHPVATTEQPAPSPAIRGAAMLGALLGLLSCAATRLGSLWYARVSLPSDADMGEKFAAGLPILVATGGVFLVSLVLTVIIIALLDRRAQRWPPGNVVRICSILGVATLLWLAFTTRNFLFELALIGLWTAIHSLFASTRGKM